MRNNNKNGTIMASHRRAKSKGHGPIESGHGVTPFLSAMQQHSFRYTSSLKDKRKVLDFVKSGGLELTVHRTIFELRMGL